MEENVKLGEQLASTATETIEVMEEVAVITREIMETGRINIHKTVTEEVVSVNLPIQNESYDINHLPGDGKVLDAPPSPRQEGNITYVPVIREITVVQKKYVVIEELQLIKKVTQTPLTQDITLRKEHVIIKRSSPSAGD